MVEDLDVEEAPDRRGLDLDLNDLRLRADVVVTVECAVEAEPRAEHNQDVGIEHESGGHRVATRPHLPHRTFDPGRDRITVTR